MNFLIDGRLRQMLLVASFAGAFCVGGNAFAQESGDQAGSEALSVRQSPERPTVHLSEGHAWNLSARFASFENTDNSFDAFGSDNEYAAAQVELGVDLGAQLLPGLRGYFIYNGGGYGKTEIFAGDATLDWRRDLLMVAADWGPQLWGFFRPSVRVGGGYARQELELSTTDLPQSDAAHDIVGFASLGVEFFTPKNFLGQFQLSLLIESGVIGQTAASFDELSDDDGVDGAWSQQTAPLGELHAGGQFVNVGLGLGLDF